MNFSTLRIALTALFLGFICQSNYAQNYITKASDKPFDFGAAKDFVVIYAPEIALAQMKDKIISDNSLDPDQINNQFYYWTADWNPELLVLTNVEEENPQNSFGGTDYLNMTPLYEWGGGSFTSKAQAYDLSKVDDDMILHIGLRDFGTAPASFKIDVGQMTDISNNGFQLETNLDLGETDVSNVGVGHIANDKSWYYIDIPVKDLTDVDGNFGFMYDFSEPFDLGESIVQLSFSKPVCSEAEGILMPGDEVQTYTITKLGSAMSVDGIWFYKVDTNGIKEVSSKGDTYSKPIVYDLNGRVVQGQPKRGIYLVKTVAGVKKMHIK